MESQNLIQNPSKIAEKTLLPTDNLSFLKYMRITREIIQAIRMFKMRNISDIDSPTTSFISKQYLKGKPQSLSPPKPTVFLGTVIKVQKAIGQKTMNH